MKWDLPGWDGDSRRDVHGYIGAPVDDHGIPDAGTRHVGWFWDLRGFCGDNADVILPRDVAEWCCDVGVSLSRVDRGIIYAMDRAFRSAMPDAVKYHEARRERKRKMEGN